MSTFPFKSLRKVGLVILLASSLHASLIVHSPDETIVVEVRLTEAIYYNLVVDGREVVWHSPIAMRTSRGAFGVDPILLASQTREVRDEIKTVWGIRNTVENHYNEL